jgi:energy-coupling factor transporter ATPase
MTPFIQVRNLSFEYPNTQNPQPVLNNINLTIEEGEWVSLVGANGSGKTTLARHFNALLLPTSGVVSIDGHDTHDPANLRSIRSQVGMVFQSPEDQIVASTVEEDIAFGLENLGVPSPVIRDRVDEVLHELDLYKVRSRPPHWISAGQMQRLALAGVLVMQPRCIIFDETTALLDPAGRKKVMEMVHALHLAGMTILWITHLMNEVLHSQRVIVLHQGQIVLQGSPQEIFKDNINLDVYRLEIPPAVRLARTIQQWLPGLPDIIQTSENEVFQYLSNHVATWKEPSIAKPIFQPTERTVVQALGLEYTYMAGTPLEQPSLRGVDFDATAGEITGLIGVTGSGKSTFLQHINGLLRPAKGEITVLDQLLHQPGVDLRKLRQQVGFVFQLPEAYFFEQYVGDEIAFGLRQHGYTKDVIRAGVSNAMETVGLPFELFKDRLIYTLSGGEKRKAALAAALAINPKLLLLDEPVAGLDPLSRDELLSRIRQMAVQGMSIVFSSHYMDDVASLCAAVTVLADGRSVLAGRSQAVFAAEEQLSAYGIEVPFIIRLMNLFTQMGIPMHSGKDMQATLDSVMRKHLEGSK